MSLSTVRESGRGQSVAARSDWQLVGHWTFAFPASYQASLARSPVTPVSEEIRASEQIDCV